MAETPRERLLRISSLRERLCLGLSSGTSADGVDAALCRIQGSGESARLELLLHRTDPFPRPLSRRIVGLKTVRELCELNFELGELFAASALRLIAQAGLGPADLHLIGTHGQTVYHLPPFLPGTTSTLQIGEAAVIAERTGILTVSDFRVRDVAAGGNGAPLVPYADYLLFRAPGKVRALQNIGGIANVSVVGEHLDQLFAFDTGPGNMVLDDLAHRATDGEEHCDRDGGLSRRGTVIPELLEELLRHPFLAAKPPKSSGREVFGEVFCDSLWERYKDRPHDLLATAALFTAESIHRAYKAYVFPRVRVDELYLSGGGSRNPTLMEHLRRLFSPTPVRRLNELGFPEEAKEAAAFALLGHECLNGAPQNVPAATGAKRAVVMGKISL